WNNQEMVNANVILGSQSKTTGSSGDVTFDEVGYDHYNIQVELENGYISEFNNIEIFSDTMMLLYVDEPTFNVKVQTVNKYTNQGIYESYVTLSGRTKQANSEGLTIFSIPQGKHQIEIEHQKYSLIKDSVEIYSDTLFSYQLLPSLSTLKFKLYEGTTPVNKVLVTIDNEQQISNNLGSAYFKEYQTFTNYFYRIEKEAYETIEANLFLVNDTTINIEMKAIPTAVFGINENENLKIWPNPARSVIHFQIPEGFSTGFAQIFDLNGNLINSFQLNSKSSHEFSLKKLGVGTYMLNIVSDEKQANRLFLKKE
ncbi:MAG TPA: T9SS type A sorting domain-containing protein, partial [Draconibacterium sp.]|nr:T9SS type A sorting domain-containing protein [Draconibacterium sp.]